MDVLNTAFLGNSIRQWGIAAAIAAGTIVALRLVAVVATRRLSALAKRTVTQWDDIITAALARTSFLFLLVVGIVTGMQGLNLSRGVRVAAGRILVLAVLLQAGVWMSTLLGRWLASYRRSEMQQDPGTATTVSALGFVGKLLLWTAILLIALDNLGVDITALVAGLGVGGVAVALAIQNILGDLFASLSIVLDKPFVLGDFLVIDDHQGNVEHIGLKTTRLRSIGGEQLIFSNSDLLKSRVRNYRRMVERRVLFPIGVTYQTPRAQLERIPTILKEAVDTQPKTRFERSHFKGFAESSITFETVYHVTVSDYTTFMDIQQAINLRIHERFEQEGIEFAYPTRTILMTKQSG